ALAQARGQFGVVVGHGAFQVERIQQRLATGLLDGVGHLFEPARLAAEQDRGRARLRAGQRDGATQSAVGAGDQDRPAFQRAARRRHGALAHAFWTSAIIRASSPLSCSSSVMSQPPISSPWMNSCGNVGQLEKRGRLARTSGSASTFTVWMPVAPAALSTSTVRLEKPHIGNCGVPFMNSTTGWFSTSALMRSSGVITQLLCGGVRDGAPPENRFCVLYAALSRSAPSTGPAMPIQPHPLPCEPTAFEPHLPAEVVVRHRSAQQAGIDALNALLGEASAGDPPALDDLAREARGALAAHAAQAWAEDFYWSALRPPDAGHQDEPRGPLAESIAQSFG